MTWSALSSVAVAQAAVVSFASPVGYPLPSGDNAVRVATGPLTGDGVDDVVTGDTNGNITVFLNRGNGTFSPGVDYATGSGSVTGVAIADVNGDGKEDVVATTEGSGGSGIFIFLGDGTGGLEAPYSVPNYDGGSGDSPTALAIGDFFHDGRVALATGGSSSGANSDKVRVFSNDGTGHFTLADTIGIGNTYTSTSWLQTADLTGDGSADIVASAGGNTETGCGGVIPLVNNGSGSFSDVGALPNICSAPKVATADFNHDGHTDIAAADSCKDFCGTAAQVERVYFGAGDGTFANSQDNLISAGDPGNAVSANLAGDGQPDLVVACSGGCSAALQVLENNGDGTFSAGPDLSGDTIDLATGQLTSSCLPDIATVGYDLQVLINTTPHSGPCLSEPLGSGCLGQRDDGVDPVICSVSPADGPLIGGTTVTVTGANFEPGDRLCFYVGSLLLPAQTACASSTGVPSGTSLMAVTPAMGSVSDARPQYLAILRLSGLSYVPTISPVTFTYVAAFGNCPGPRTVLHNEFPLVRVPVTVPLKPYSVTYGQLGLPWHSVSPPAHVSCSLQSGVGALPVLVSTTPFGLPPIISVLAAQSVASARLDYFQKDAIAPPSCNWSTISHDCSLNGDGPLMVRWHTDGFDEEVPVTHLSFWNSGPLTYYVNVASPDISAGLQDLEAYIHTTLIAHLAMVEKIALIQEPPADVGVRGIVGRVTGRKPNGTVGRGIAGAIYVTNHHGYAAVILPDPLSAPYVVTVLGQPRKRFSLSMSVLNVSGAGANSVDVVTKSGRLNGLGRYTASFTAHVSGDPVFSRHAAVVRSAHGRQRIRVTYGVPAAHGPRGLRLHVACRPKSGSLFTVGRHVVVCVAQGTVGSAADASFAVKVRR